MYWVEVDGCTLPKPVGGHPALDFCNTLAGWDGPPLDKGEWLREPDTFLVWTSFAGLLDSALLPALRDRAGEEPDEAQQMLEQARQLRAALYATLRHSDAKAFEVVAALAEEAAGRARLVRRPDGSARWELPAELGLRLPLLLVAQAAADLLTSENRHRVRACPGDDCGWLFVDRHGRRRWCSMETCGNRAKARAFAHRQRQAQQ